MRAVLSSGMGAWALVALKERGCVPVGGEFRFDWAGLVEAFENGFNVSQHREFAGASDIIPFQGYSAKFCASPIFMHSFIIFEQDVEEVLGVLLPDILQAKIFDHEGERNGAGRVCPETRGVFGGSVSVGGEDGC